MTDPHRPQPGRSRDVARADADDRDRPVATPAPHQAVQICLLIDRQAEVEDYGVGSMIRHEVGERASMAALGDAIGRSIQKRGYVSKHAFVSGEHRDIRRLDSEQINSPAGCRCRDRAVLPRDHLTWVLRRFSFCGRPLGGRSCKS